MLFRSIKTKEAILSPMLIEHVLPKMKNWWCYVSNSNVCGKTWTLRCITRWKVWCEYHHKCVENEARIEEVSINSFHGTYRWLTEGRCSWLIWYTIWRLN
jgi:hypothetical protein